MLKRTLGKTGQQLSIVGAGGIVFMNETPDSAAPIVKQAIERGVNYFDVAPTYGDAELNLGPALEPYRKDVFLACKTAHRTKAEAWEQLHTSLERLRTDHVDLYQLHGVSSLEDVDAILAPDGALHAFLQARDQGLTRFIGFSAHSEEAGIALIDRVDFDTVLFPLNVVCWHQGNFGPRLLEKAQSKNMGILALKALAKTEWKEDQDHAWPKCWYAPVDNPERAALHLRWTLSLPVTAAVSPSHADLLWWACDAADHFTPLSDDEQKTLAESTRGLKPIFPQ